MYQNKNFIAIGKHENIHGTWRDSKIQFMTLFIKEVSL